LRKAPLDVRKTDTFAAARERAERIHSTLACVMQLCMLLPLLCGALEGE
jgi:hypothetical protein